MTGSRQKKMSLLETVTHKFDRCQRRMCFLFVTKPVWVFSIGMIVLLTLCMIAAPNMEVSEESEYDWTITSSTESINQDITTNLLSRVDAADGASSLTPILSEVVNRYGLQIMYEVNDEHIGEAIFTPESLKSICEIESLLWDMEEYQESFCVRTSNDALKMPGSVHCATPMLSLVPRFYSWPPFGAASSRECTLLTEEQVAAVATSLFTSLLTPGSPTAYFLGSDSLESLVRVRSLLPLGGPLPGYENLNDRKSEQLKLYIEFAKEWEAKLFDLFGLENTFIKSAYRNEALRGPIQASYVTLLFNQLEMGRVVNGDLLWTLASILFVFLYMAYYTESIFLASVGMLQILFSLPIAFFFYRYVFQIPYYSQLQILTIFLVLGVGADDIFVLVDSWKQTLSEPEFNQSTFHRMFAAYKRAFSAIFNTSFTTAMAFLSTALSPIMPISAFGIYAAVAIVINYVYVITFTPAAVLIQYYYFSNATCCRCVNKKSPEYKVITWEEACAVNLEELSEAQFHRRSLLQNTEVAIKASSAQRFFQGPYTRFITNRKCSFSVVVVCTAIICQGFYYASQLTPPISQEQWFSADHMWTGIFDTFSNEFLAGPDNAYVDASFVWGVDSLDRKGYNVWKPGENRGSVRWNEDFNLADPAAQAVILTACTTLRTEPCTLRGCMDNSRKVTRLDSVQCWLEEFQIEEGGTLPTGEAFLPALTLFRQQHPQHAPNIGLVDGVLRYARIQFVLTLELQQPLAVTESMNQKLNELLNVWNEDSPASLGNGLVDAGRAFTWTRTEEGLVNGMFTGFAICFPVAFFVLLLATGGNVVLAILASVTIAAIVSTVLGICQGILGWHLGIAESISAVIVIGFSVDYVCHLSHPYTDSASPFRKERVSEAARTMGATVAAGGVTTLGAGLCMFGCQMVFFSKMAILISLTITVSIGYSLGFFMCLLALIGPQGNMKIAMKDLPETQPKTASAKIIIKNT